MIDTHAIASGLIAGLDSPKPPVKSRTRATSDPYGPAAVALGVPPSALRAVPLPRSILGTSTKTVKASKASRGADIKVAYLAPGSMLARTVKAPKPEQSTVCPMARVIGCEGPCLGADDGRGHLSMPKGTARLAQLGRTLWALGDPYAFGQYLAAEIRSFARKSRRPFVRLDGTSDLGIGSIPAVRQALKRHGVTAYDYTKLPGRALNTPGVTFSAAPKSIKAARRVLEAGRNVSVVIATRNPDVARQTAAAIFPGFQAIDGDASEPLDRGRSQVRALTLKAGSAEAFNRSASSPLVFRPCYN